MSRFLECPASTMWEHAKGSPYTIDCNRNLSKLEAALRPDDYEKLTDIFPTGKCKVWGFKHGPVNEDTFYDLRDGDKALFFDNLQRSFAAIGSVALKVKSAALCRAVWPGGQYNEYPFVFFVRDLDEIRLPLARYVSLVRYARKYEPAHIRFIRGDKADAVLQECRTGS